MLDFHVLDVFTETRFTGNPLAVVTGADGLSRAQMQAIAREFQLSETIFVMHPRDPAHAARVRIFTPAVEMAFAGHPTIGCAIFLAETEAGPGDFTRALVLEEEAGLVPVRIRRQGGLTRAEFDAPVLPELAAGPAPDAGMIAAALGLAPAAISLPGHAPRVATGGNGFLYVPLASLDDLALARPQEPGWGALTAACGMQKVYLYTPGTACDWQARMFGPGDGVNEDPATGSATAIFAAPLLAAGALPEGETRLVLRQGVEMGRPSQLGLGIRVEDGRLARVSVSGAAVRVSKGSIHPPAR